MQGYWEGLIIIASDELQKLRQLELGNEYHVAVDNRDGNNQGVAHDVIDISQDKSAYQLDELKIKIETKISSKNDGVDIDYW